MVRDQRVKMLSFTGSAEVGWRLRQVAATPRVTLELGGNGAVIVHEPTRTSSTRRERCAFGGFLRAGQACISVQRLYVHERVFDAFKEQLLARIARAQDRESRSTSDTVVGGLDRRGRRREGDAV